MSIFSRRLSDNPPNLQRMNSNRRNNDDDNDNDDDGDG